MTRAMAAVIGLGCLAFAVLSQSRWPGYVPGGFVLGLVLLSAVVPGARLPKNRARGGRPYQVGAELASGAMLTDWKGGDG